MPKILFMKINRMMRLLIKYGQEDITLDISNFSRGIYLLNIKTDLGEIAKKVIKNKG